MSDDPCNRADADTSVERWVGEELARGIPPHEITGALIENGWAPLAAKSTVETSCAARLAASREGIELGRERAGNAISMQIGGALFIVASMYALYAVFTLRSLIDRSVDIAVAKHEIVNLHPWLDQWDTRPFLWTAVLMALSAIAFVKGLRGYLKLSRREKRKVR